MQPQWRLRRLKTAQWRTNTHGFTWYIHIAWTPFVASPSLDRRLRTAHWRRVTFMFAWKPKRKHCLLHIRRQTTWIQLNVTVFASVIAGASVFSSQASSDHFLIFLSFHRHVFCFFFYKQAYFSRLQKSASTRLDCRLQETNDTPDFSELLELSQFVSLLAAL